MGLETSEAAGRIEMALEDTGYRVRRQSDGIYIENGQVDLKILTDKQNVTYGFAYLASELWDAEFPFSYRRSMRGKERLRQREILEEGEIQVEIPDSLSRVYPCLLESSDINVSKFLENEEVEKEIARSLQELDKGGISSSEVAEETSLSPVQAGWAFASWENRYELNGGDEEYRLGGTRQKWNRDLLEDEGVFEQVLGED